MTGLTYPVELAVTIAGLMACGLIGSVLVTWLPWRQQAVAGTFLAPVLGVAVLVLIATLVGWFGAGFRHFPTGFVTFALLVGAAWHQRRLWRAFLRRAGLWAAFGAVGSLPLLHQCWLAGAFNTFGDSFMYITHAQWLQEHGFLTAAQPTTEYPAWAQVAGFQVCHFRMGASFFFGWVQALTGAVWSYEVYPAVVMIGFVAGSLVAGAAVLWAAPRRWIAAWLAALGAAVTLNGFAFGAVHGFLHQTFGLALGTAALVLWGAALFGRDNGAIRFRFVVPISVCAAASMHSYSEFAPFMFSAAIASILLPPRFARTGWNRRWRIAWPTAALTILLVNLEWVRAVKAFFAALAVVVGRPFNWSWLRYPAHSLGLAAGESLPVLPASPFTVSAWGYWLGGFIIVVAFLMFITWTRPNRSPRGPLQFTPLVPLAALLIFGALAFLWFRYGVASPWKNDARAGAFAIGQTWHQFKLANWLSLAAISLALALLTGSSRLRNAQSVVIAALMLWCGTGLAMNLAHSKSRLAGMLARVGVASNPFGVFQDLRRALETKPVTDVIRIEAEPDDAKVRWLLVYFLHDRKLSAKWDDDAALLPQLLKPINSADAAWIIRVNRTEFGLPDYAEKFGRISLEPVGAAHGSTDGR